MADAAEAFDARFYVGDVVKVELPRGHNKRGVWGISVLYTTSPEAKFDGAIGRVAEVVPRGPFTIPQYLVDFQDFDNSRVGIPWQAHWFREEFLELVERPELTLVEPGPEAELTESDRALTDIDPASTGVVAKGNGWAVVSGVSDCPSGYPIKGSRSSRTFITPGHIDYPLASPEICFATEDDALMEGYRAGRLDSAK
jgi:hypothetical protein